MGVIATMRTVGLLACALVLIAAVSADGDVEQLGSGEEEHAHQIHQMHWHCIRQTAHTMHLVQQKVLHNGPHMNILGFFGCAFHCKHEPDCTSKCMEKKHIPNGFDAATKARDEQHIKEEEEALSKERVRAATDMYMSLIQDDENAQAKRKRHKPIKLHPSEGKGEYHTSPARPQESSTNPGFVTKDSAELQKESDTSNDFSVREFFHCAYGCHHKIACETKCMNRHSDLRMPSNNDDVDY